MKKKKALAIGGALVLIMTGVPLKQAWGAESAWSLKMRGLYRTLTDLMTDVASPKRFNDPANAPSIERDTRKIAQLAHDLNKKGVVVPDSDPSLRILSGMMAEQTKTALEELKRGHRAYARTLLKAVPGYCIACHTRNSSGPQFKVLPLEPSHQAALTPVERGEFYAATRQFDRAMTEFIQVIDSAKTGKEIPPGWSKAVHDSLAIAVRVKESPVIAGKVVESVLRAPAAPVFERRDAEKWKSSIAAWRRELPRSPKTQAGLYSELLRLMRQAHKAQRYPADRSGDVYYLRASAVAHELLAKAPHGKYSEQALLMAGICYEVLSPVNLEDLHEIYYEACIRRAPHTSIAETCYSRYEQSTYLDYTGSAGLDLPSDVRAKLKELQEMAAKMKEIKK